MPQNQFECIEQQRHTPGKDGSDGNEALLDHDGDPTRVAATRDATAAIAERTRRFADLQVHFVGDSGGHAHAATDE